MKIVLPVTPIGKPRMTQRDKWKHRLVVDAYYAFKDHLRLEVNLRGYTITPTLDIVFYIPMPPSWSKKKRSVMLGAPHQQRPDIDNLIKAFTDALLVNDEAIWSVRARKFWAETGSIEIEQ